MIRVLIVDDSAFMRRLLTKVLEPYEDIEVVATAMDGVFALDKIERLEQSPDVITLDLEMPRLDGMSTLKRIVDKHQLPVVLVSAHTSKGAQVTFDALAAGAVDFITKPDRIFSFPVASLGKDLVAKIRVAARAKIRRPGTRATPPSPRPRVLDARAAPARDVVGIAVSTGGPNALSTLLAEIQSGFQPALLIVQHMPEGFTGQFAERLARLARIEVREAADGDTVTAGCALVAPGGRHMVVEREKARVTVRLTHADPVGGHRPSADVLFRSIAEVVGVKSVGMILTGMGEDGAEGISAIQEAGGHTLAQDESSSVVYGMPKAAIERGVVDRVLPLSEMAGYLNSLSSEHERQQRGSSWIA